MRIIGCDFHTRQQTLAMLDTETGELVKMTLQHEGNTVREFYSVLPRPVCVGLEATGSMQWFVNLLEKLGMECQVGNPAVIRAAERRKQKHDRRDAGLILKLLMEDRFPAIWLPSKELQDLRALVRHRHQWVRMRTRIQNALQSVNQRVEEQACERAGARLLLTIREWGRSRPWRPRCSWVIQHDSLTATPWLVM